MHRCLRVLFGPISLAAAFLAHAEETLYVQVPAVLDEEAPIAAAVQRECNVESTMGNHVFHNVQTRYNGPTQIAVQPGGRELRLTILGVMGVGPGPWSGTKQISLRADLVQDGTLVTTNVFRREVGGGGRIRGACALFDIVALRLARDVGSWLPVALSDIPAVTSKAPATQQSSTEGSDALQRLRVLKGLLDDGLIKQDEYDRKRAEVLRGL